MPEALFGKIQVYTGQGKGKTTVALGLALRALGHNKKVVIIYFDKGGQNYGERKILDSLVGDNFQYYVTGRERFNRQANKFDFTTRPKDKQEAQRGLRMIKDIFKEALIDLIILDEINSVLHLGLLDLDTFLAVLDRKPKHLEVVLTGRAAHPRILARADLVTEMKLVKHYFYQGVGAREGIEY